MNKDTYGIFFIRNNVIYLFSYIPLYPHGTRMRKKYRQYFDICSMDLVFPGCNFKFALGFHRVATFMQPLCKIAWSVREYLHDIEFKLT